MVYGMLSCLKRVRENVEPSHEENVGQLFKYFPENTIPSCSSRKDNAGTKYKSWNSTEDR